MRMSTRLLSLLSVVALAGSCTNKDPVTLNISAAGLTDDEGAVFKVAIVDVDGKKVIDTDTGTVSGGRLTSEITVDADTTYRVDVYVDKDDDGHCQAGVDDVFAVEIAKQSGGSTKAVAIDRTAPDSRGCLAWGGSTLHVELSNFTGQSGQVYKAQLSRVDGNTVVAVRTAGLTSNLLKLDFEGAIIPDHFYQVDLFIDVNANGVCNASTDPIYTKRSTALPPPQLEGLTGETVPLLIDGSLSANQGSSCSNFQ